MKTDRRETVDNQEVALTSDLEGLDCGRRLSPELPAQYAAPGYGSNAVVKAMEVMIQKD